MSGDVAQGNDDPPPRGPYVADGEFLDDERSRSFDIAGTHERPSRDFIIEDVWPVKSVLAIVGEEGDGKTLLADQMLRQLVRREPILGAFEPGGRDIERVLFVDTEMEDEDAWERDAEMRQRGLALDLGRMFWWSPGGLDLSDPRDVELLMSEVRRRNVDLVWIDSGINAVADATDEVAVKHLFNNLKRLQRQCDLAGVGLSLHTRKTQEGRGGRRFDDLYGSREWKGRVNTALYIDKQTITAWKNRGGRLRKLWPLHRGHPQATLERPGYEDDSCPPFRVSIDGSRSEDSGLEQEVREILLADPDTLTKDALAKKLGGNRQSCLKEIQRLLDAGLIGPNEPRKRLHWNGPQDGTLPAEFRFDE